MKICATCGTSMPDNAEYCDVCGSDEFLSEYGQPQPQQQYEQQQYAQMYQNDYQQPYPQDQYGNNGYQQQYPRNQYQDNGYPQQYQQNPYQNNGYQQPYQQNQYQNNGYQQQYPQNQYQDNGYQQQYPQNQYQDNGYQQQYPQEQYQDNGYQQQYPQEQYQDNDGYQQPYQQEQPYEQEQYEQPPQQEQQPEIIEEPVTENPPVQEETPPPEEPKEEEPQEEEPQEEEPQEEEPQEEAPQEPKENPYEVSKNFKFEKSEAPVQQPIAKEKPKNIKEFIASLKDTKDHTIEYDKNDAAKNKSMAILACFGLTFWTPFVFRADSRFSRFYGNQGLLILITMIPCTILFSIFAGFVGMACTNRVTFMLEWYGWIVDLIFFGICYSIPIFMIACSVNNIKAGKAKDIPFIGKLRLIS